MPKNPPEGMPRLTPHLFYNDLPAALEWLGKAFGFQKRFEVKGPYGSIIHAEMAVHDAVIMMGPTSEDFPCYRSASDLPAVNQSLYIYVDNVDAHCERARSSGAKILREPEDQFWGDRTYAATDCEGHHWGFGQHIKDVPPEELRPPGM